MGPDRAMESWKVNQPNQIKARKYEHQALIVCGGADGRNVFLDVVTASPRT
jgi:hypothetical protein